ncbi:MAG: RNA polymerase sigma-70 factor [Tannerellaceae bacterium]|nr:RNA polymerase sigma-70 factor [Tannerellaceae bacterium]
MGLIERLKRSDRHAFNELYKLHYLSLLSYAELLLSDADEAKDVVQDVFLNVWVNRRRLDENLSFRGYLLRSVYNSALNVLKKKSHSADYLSSVTNQLKAAHYYDPDSNEIIHSLYVQELGREIHKAIDNLPDRCREIFVMSYIEDRPGKEISRELGISQSTVDNHIYSALKQLRIKLKKFGKSK